MKKLEATMEVADTPSGGSQKLRHKFQGTDTQQQMVTRQFTNPPWTRVPKSERQIAAVGTSMIEKTTRIKTVRMDATDTVEAIDHPGGRKTTMMRGAAVG